MQELQQAFENFVKIRKGKGLRVCEVTDVSKTEYVFDCVDGDGNEYLDVRMNATPVLAGVLQVPLLGSSVIISDLGNQNEDFVLIQASQLERLLIHLDTDTGIFINEAFIKLGGDPLESAVRGETLNANLTDLINAVKDVVQHLQTFSTTQTAASVGPLAPLAVGFTTLGNQMPAKTAALNTVLSALEDHLSTVVKITE